MDQQRAVSTSPQGAALLERVVIEGDLSKLTPAERVNYYAQVCQSLGLNPLTKPFDYLYLNSKLILYAKKDCADQLRKRDMVSITGLDYQVINDVYVVKAQARVGERTDMATGAVSIAGLKGDALANAMLKSETKAKRRVTLSICGLGMLDETEVETINGAQHVTVTEAGEFVVPQSAPIRSVPIERVTVGPSGERIATPVAPLGAIPVKPGERMTLIIKLAQAQGIVPSGVTKTVKELYQRGGLSQCTDDELLSLISYYTPKPAAPTPDDVEIAAFEASFEPAVASQAAEAV